MKITIVGGGSYTWSFGFIRQFVHSERLKDATITLMDTNPEALDLVASAGAIYSDKHGSPIRLEAMTDLDRALDGADFVLVTITTGGLEAMRHDLDIPERYGIRHTVGDTTGPAGWSRAARNIPMFYDLAERMTRRCPDGWLVNFSNPLTALTRVPYREFGIEAIGMCPGVEDQARMLARLAGASGDARIEYVVVGVDHGSWFTSLFADGTDVLRKLRDMGYGRGDTRLSPAAITDNPMAGPRGNQTNFALWQEFGYMPTVPDRHTVENHPWFILTGSDDLPYGVRRTSVQERQKGFDERKANLQEYVTSRGESDVGKLGHGDDPVLQVIEALCGHHSFLWGSNYRNIGQMPGAPEGAVVETRCLFDAAGVHPLCSPVPEVLRPLILPHILRQEAIVPVVLRGSFDEFVALVASDPLYSGLSPGTCREMMKEMLTATRRWIRNPRLLEFS